MGNRAKIAGILSIASSAVIVWIVTIPFSLSVTLFLLHKFSASASVSSGSVSFDAFYVAKEPIVDVDTDFAFRATKNDAARSFVRRLFSTDIGAFVDDTGDGIDLGLFFPTWFVVVGTFILLSVRIRKNRTSRRWTSPIPDRAAMPQTFRTVKPGSTPFDVVTAEGVFSDTANAEDLGRKRDKRLADLFHQRHPLITQMRIADERRRAI
jgi:hypothetical protein